MGAQNNRYIEPTEYRSRKMYYLFKINLEYLFVLMSWAGLGFVFQTVS